MQKSSTEHKIDMEHENRIQQYIKRIMYHDQVGFISEIQDCLDIQISITRIHHTN